MKKKEQGPEAIPETADKTKPFGVVQDGGRVDVYEWCSAKRAVGWAGNAWVYTHSTEFYQ